MKFWMMKLRPAVERTGSSEKPGRMRVKTEVSNEGKTLQFLQGKSQESRQSGGELKY